MRSGKVLREFKGSADDFATGGTGGVAGVSWPVFRYLCTVSTIFRPCMIKFHWQNFSMEPCVVTTEDTKLKKYQVALNPYILCEECTEGWICGVLAADGEVGGRTSTLQELAKMPSVYTRQKQWVSWTRSH